MKVFAEGDAHGTAIPVGRSWVNREWVGRGPRKRLITLEGGPFLTYYEARENAEYNPRSFTQQAVEVDN